MSTLPAVHEDKEPLLGVWQIGENYTVHDVNENEGSSVVDGKYILARVVAESFFLDGVSRNRRRYPATAWRRALQDPELIRRLNRRLVFGTFGHDQVLDDAAIREGKFSHIVSRIWITEDGKGMAEFLILNTGPGERLNTIFRAGSRPYVSTRASGGFQKARDNQGNQIVDPESFALGTIDFVLDPGFLDADPELVENNNSVKGTQMNENEKIQTLEESVRNGQTLINNLTEQNTAQATQITKMEEELAAYRALGSADVLAARVNSGLEESLKAVLGTHTADGLKSTLEEHASYSALGTVAYIKESLDSLTHISENLGSAKDIEHHLREHLDLVRTLKSTPAQIKSMVESFEALTEAHGGVDAIEETLTKTAAFVEKCGSLEECESILVKSLEFFESVGTAENIRSALNRVLEMVESQKAAKVEESVLALAEELQQSPELIREALDKGLDEATIRSLAESRAPVTSPKSQITGRLFEDKKPQDNKENQNRGPRTLAESLIS